GTCGQFQIARDFVTEKDGSFAKEPAKTGCRRFLVAHDRQLVLNEWVVDDSHALHGSTPGWFCPTIEHKGNGSVGLPAATQPDTDLCRSNGSSSWRGGQSSGAVAVFF